MKISGVSSQIVEFISRNLKSVAELEALLLLDQDSQKSWTPDELSQSLRFNPSYAESLLSHLVNQGLAVRDTTNANCYRLDPQYAKETSVIKELAALYQAKRISVIQMIYELQNDKLQDFAQAFKLRK